MAKLPDWVGGGPQFAPADSPSNARGWVCLGETYSCVESEMYPWDPEIVRAIRSFCPDYVPVWMRTAYLSPDKREVVVAGRHVIARSVRNLHTPPHYFRVLLPCGYAGPRPNLLERVMENDDGRDGFAGTYRPLDWRAVAELRAAYLENQTPKEAARAWVARHQEARERAKAEMHNEIAYRTKHDEGFVKRMAERISDVEWKTHGPRETHTPRVFLRESNG